MSAPPLTANSTFLPVIDDLLSPDFRTVSLPGQTPQTPAETPHQTVKVFAEDHKGQLTSKVSSFSGRTTGDGGRVMSASLTQSQVGGLGQGVAVPAPKKPVVVPRHSAATKIQRWWKKRQNSCPEINNVVIDLRAERAKHTIRHNRTEEHVRFLETEVQRLKSALATERKLRALQVEAIKSLWNQVQKVSSISSATPITPDTTNVMTQSMPPNGFPGNVRNNNKKNQGGGVGIMSMSLNIQEDEVENSQSHPHHSCSCADEIQHMKDKFADELTQMRKMIEHMKVSEGSHSPKPSRPLTLDLANNPTNQGNTSGIGDRDAGKHGGKQEISGYADQMASSIIKDAKDDDDQ